MASRLSWEGWAGVGAIIGGLALLISFLAWQLPKSPPQSTVAPPSTSPTLGSYTSPTAQATTGVPTSHSTSSSSHSSQTTTETPRLDPLSLPEGMLGTWRGIVQQSSSKYPMTLTLSGGTAGDIVGRSEYPTLPCTGNLRLLSGGDDVVLQEEVSGSCITGEVHLELIDRNTILYKWGKSGPTTATLVRS